MSIRPIQSNSATALQKTERPSLPASNRARDGEAVSTLAKNKDFDAVRVSVQSEKPEKAPPPLPPPQSYQARPQDRANNFKDIDSDSNGELSKEELTSAKESRNADGKRTPFIDRALASYDQQTESSGQSGITFEQFYRKDKSAPPPPPPPPEA